MLCGTFGCTLPDSHAGLHQVPAPARACERRPTAKALDDSSDSDVEQPAAVVTASRSRRTKASAPTSRIKKKRTEKKCEHGRQRNICKECGGSGICVHGRVRHDCKECGGTHFCEHGRRRSVCKECGGGSGICEHGRVRYGCKACGGAGICNHGRRRHRCKECVVLAMADDDGGLFDFLDVMSDFDLADIATWRSVCRDEG